MPGPRTLAMELGNNSQLVGVFRTQVCNGFYFQSSVHSRFDGNLKQAANLITDCESACCAQIGAGGVGICSAAAASTQNGKLGCGFVDPNAAVTEAAAKTQVAKQGFKFMA
jgi:hypothetical protein